MVIAVMFTPDRFQSHAQRKIILQSYDMNTITGAQMRAARALIRWSAQELASPASVGIATVRRAEAEDGLPSTTIANLKAIRHALEAVGVEFLSENGSGHGVRACALFGKEMILRASE